MDREHDYADFHVILSRAALLTAYSRGKDFDDLVPVFFQELMSYQLEDVRTAVSAHCNENRFFPTLADIVSRLKPDDARQVFYAWSIVINAVRRFGNTITLRFPSPAFHFAIMRLDRNGWCWICEHLTNEKSHLIKRDFEEAFKYGLRDASWNEEEGKIRVPAYLLGTSDLLDIKNGYLQGVPKVIDAVSGEVISESVFELSERENRNGKNVLARAAAMAREEAVKKLALVGGIA